MGERPGNLPIELSGVKAAVLCIPYSLSSGGKKAGTGGTSWPPRAARGGTGGGGANSLPLGALNDPMDMGQMRNSLGNIGRGSSATFGGSGSQARGYAQSDAASLAGMSQRGGDKYSQKGGYSNHSASGFDARSMSHSTVGTDVDEGPRGSFRGRGAPGY